ncbi:unnamed protein product [Paramecium pentaurelia]|uniref:Uncharacterized protein n=1 Tax=Paramecium pentaurelia TaxID=43138 RepID=A0A8S1Y9E5_9CILI|nr:unnamed protein product [Paramecium pentaurelia]
MLQIKFDKWVKIRIGEPITAFDVDNNMIIFGAISGYIGQYLYNQNELRYIPDVFEEIIRGVTIDQDKVYIVVGDVYGYIFDYQMRESHQWKFERPHSPPLCSSTLSLCYKTKTLLLSVAPTQNKDIGVDISTKKNSLYLFDLQNQDSNTYYADMPLLQVPFDFKGDQLLMLEYLKEAKKKLSILYLNDQPQIIILLDIDPKIEYISHGRFIKNGILFVENHKIVKIYNPIEKSQKVIKITKQQIVALDYHENDLTLLEYDGTVTLMVNEEQIIQFNILKVVQIPQELVKHKYLFDMGYPYYIKKREKRIVISHDLGLLSFTLQM